MHFCKKPMPRASQSQLQSARLEMVCMCSQEQLPPKVQSSAHTLHGFCAQVSRRLCLSFTLPMPDSRLRLLMQFRIGSRALLVEQGGLARSAIPRHLHCCTFCETTASADETHFVLTAPNYLSTFATSFTHCIEMQTVPRSMFCGTSTRRLSAVA